MKALPPSPGFLIVPYSSLIPTSTLPRTHPAIDRLIRKVRENPTPNRQR